MSDFPSSVLVTGSSGFVGAHLCDVLVKNGWRVVAAVRTPGVAGPIPGTTEVCLSMSSDGAGDWQRALKSVRCVVHLAAHVHITKSAQRSRSAFYEVNVLGSQHVAEQAARAGVRRLIFMSSIKVNGEGCGLRGYRADDTPGPSDPYGESKMQAEQVLREFCFSVGLELVIIRPPLVYGPGVRANFQRLIRLCALGLPLPLLSIENRRSLIGIWNLVNFVETCMRHPNAASATWLISDGEDLSTPELLRRLSRLMQKPVRLFAFSPRLLRRIGNVIGMGAEVDRLCTSLVIDSTPARELLHWSPITGVDEGLARTVKAYRESLRV